MNPAPERSADTTDAVPASIRSLPELFQDRVRRSPNGEAYRQFDTARGAWASTNWAQAGEQVLRWQQALARLSLPAGARVALLLPNGLQAVWADQAALALGCVPVPMHALDNAGSIAFIVADSQASVLVAQSTRQWSDIAAVGTPMPALKAVITVETEASFDAAASPVPVFAADAWLAQAAQAQHALPLPPKADDLACVVYTSGTTGRPKGVMLTHANVLANVRAVLAHVGARSDDVFLSFLPLSHTFERTLGYYLPIATGGCVAYARSVGLLAEDLRTVRPTVLVSVPRIYERVHAQLQQLLAASPFKAWLFARAEAVGWRRFRLQQGLVIGERDHSRWEALDPIVWPVLQALVARPLLARFGGRLQIAVSGGAPLSPTIARCFLGLGLPVLQGYGMTETSPVVSANRLQSNDPATVGEVVAGVEVRLGADRELQVRGPSVMKGYWNKPTETQNAFTEDGWLRTGDQAALDAGRVRILGRLKEIIVTSTGEKVPPGDLELAITADPLFEQVFVVGDNRPFITAVAVLNATRWAALAAELGVDPAAPASLQLPAVREAALKRIAQQAAAFPRHAIPKAVFLSLTPWTVENTLMTPTLKLKRSNLMAHFAQEIAAMYAPG